MINPLFNSLLTRSVLATALAATLLVLLAGCSAGSDDTSQPGPGSASASTTATTTTQVPSLTAAQRKHIQTFTVAPVQYHKTIETTGTVDYDRNQATTVLAPFSGPVSKSLVSVGDTVTQGQPLALVDSPDFAAAISTYRKALASADAAHRLAELDKDLLQHHGISRREFTQAQADAIGAAADVDAARQTLVALHVDSGAIKAIAAGKSVPAVQGIIRSPISGTIVAKTITPGELLQAGTTPCFVVADLSQVWVNAHLFGNDIGNVRSGDSAEVASDASEKPLPGRVAHVSAELDPDTGAVAARIVVNNPGDALKKGQYVRVLIHSPTPTAGLMVPVSAILRNEQNLPFVYIARTDGGFARRRVDLGYRDSNRFAITSGLQAGERIVADGGLFLRFMESQ